MSSSPWIRLIVPFGVRNSTLPVFGACEFFFEPPLPASGQSRLRQSTGRTRPKAMRKMPAPLHNVDCSQRTSTPERPAQIAWPCSLRHCHCSTLRYLPFQLLLWSSWSYMFWMAKVPDNNSEVYDVGDRRFTMRWHGLERVSRNPCRVPSTRHLLCGIVLRE